ncbi:MAG: glycosyltransferase family 39 protein [Chloroflexi bacterium]|nr:glycosyltransferase family 39 protein [Chloroflexota bacterium]
MRSSRVQTAGLRITLLVILLAAFALRLHDLTLQNIWWDEARNIDVALRPFTQIATAPELDIQPPFYFWLLHGWGQVAGLAIKNNPLLLAFFMRFVSVGAGLLGTALLYQLGRLVFSPTAGLYAAMIALLSPFWLAESQETRMYTLGFALLTGAAVALMSEIEDRRLESTSDRPIAFFKQRHLIAFVILSTLSLLTHYNAVFILVAWYGWWGAWALWQPDRWRQLRRVFFCGLAMTLLVAPIAPIALRQIPTYANPNLVIPTLRDYLRQNWQGHLGGYAFDPAMLYGQGITWLWVVLGLAVVGLVLASLPVKHWLAEARGASRIHFASPLSAARENEQNWHSSLFTHHTTFLLVWLFGSLALYYIAVLDRGAFNIRYSSFVTPALYVLIGIACAGWRRWWRPLGVVGLVILAVGMAPAIWADLYDVRFAREDMAGVTQWLNAHTQRGDVVFVDQKYPFGFYYERYSIDPKVTPAGVEKAPARYLFVDINTLDQVLNQWAGKTKHVFWVQWFESDTDPRHAVPFLLDKVGQHTGEQAFRGYTINTWTLQPPNHFELAPQLKPLPLAFPPAVETVAISLPDQLSLPGGHLPVVIRWQRSPQAGGKQLLKARVAFYDQNNARLAQADERLLNDRHVMPYEWSQTDHPLNVYMLALPTELAAGAYEVRLLVYDAETLVPLTVTDQAGNPAGQEAILGTIRIAEK